MATNEQIHIEDGSEGMYRNENTLLKKGILAGILTLGFACTASSVLSFVRRVQELKKIKRHEVIRKNLTSEETDYVGCTTEQAPDLFLRCSCCGKEAHDIDEITVLFGYQKMENGKLSPYNYCKQCRKKNEKAGEFTAFCAKSFADDTGRETLWNGVKV